VVAGMLQVGGDELLDRRLIFDEQNVRRHMTILRIRRVSFVATGQRYHRAAHGGATRE
jgi:hypothetical protein